MRSCASLVFAVVLLAGCIFAQDSSPASASPLSSKPAVPVPPPVDVKPVDLTPDATGTVPVEQIRELLRRAEEKDLENDKQQRDYTYIEREEEHKLGSHGE